MIDRPSDDAHTSSEGHKQQESMLKSNNLLASLCAMEVS